ncbi:VanZ family protein [Massilia sp. TWR1-2-2]|uniref:VanZ family protein n=1 Tax=Massilia sp. TWR1-2-2 TaxID=2804584 RepID=UPI003CF300A6
MVLEQLLFAGASAAMLAGCLVPNSWLPRRLPNDKLMHFAGFAFLSVLAVRLASSQRQMMLAMLGLLAAGLLIECLQILVPERKFCWRDMAANAAGVASVALGAHLYLVFA